MVQGKHHFGYGTLTAAVVVWLGGCSCPPSSAGAGAPPPPAEAGEAVAAGADPAQAPPATEPPPAIVRIRAIKTVSGKTAIASIKRAYENGDRAYRDNPKNRLGLAQLFDALSDRAQLLGTLSDYDRIETLANEEVEQFGDRKAYLRRARARAALHQFDAALADYDEVEKRGAQNLEAFRASVYLGLGRYDEALAGAQADSAKDPSFVALTFEAAVLGRMGRIDEAEKKFEEAEGKFRRGSAQGLAWHCFQRGSMWQRAGNEAMAKWFFQEAAERMPLYAHAVVHYADFLEPKAAKSYLEPLLETSEDPEVRMALARIREKEAPGSGKDLVEEARSKYATLMAKHPEAFADHAGWFYLDPLVAEPAKAVEAAELNLKVRKVPEAYQLLLSALMAANDDERLCPVAEDARQLPYPTPSLHATLHATDAKCGPHEHEHAPGHEHGHDHAHGKDHDHGHAHGQADHDHADGKADHDHAHGQADHDHGGGAHPHPH